MIVIDFSKKQAQALNSVIKKQEDKLDKRAFELEKNGAGTGTVVSLTQEPLDDLTDAEHKAYEKASEEFDKSIYEGLCFVQDKTQSYETHTLARLDVSLIGYDNAPKQGEENPFEDAEDPTQQL